MRREPFTMDELRAMALGRSSRRSTIWGRKACRAGMSKALTMPWNTLSQRISGTVIRCERARAARAKDWIMDSTWVTTSTRCRSRRSTHTPAKGPRTKAGIWLIKPVRPSRKAEPVIRYTSQLVASRVIQVPTSERLCPPKNSR